MSAADAQRLLAAINEVEHLLQYHAEDRGRIALIFDPANGWCLSDDMDALKPKMGPEAPEFRVIAYKQWFQPSFGLAVLRMMEIKRARREG